MVPHNDPTFMVRRWPGAGGSVSRVLVLADEQKPPVGAALPEVVAFLEGHGVAVQSQHDVRRLTRHEVRGLGGPPPDLVVVLGGDGSVLTAVQLFEDTPIPTIGINFGRVGFLASVEATRWREGLLEVLQGKGLVEPRMRLSARVERANGDAAASWVALNDVVLSRGASPSMIAVRLFDGPARVADYRADGLIFATPSGSTAYSLAAGGPILAPSMAAVVVTPISAHALSHRPLVMGAAHELRAVLTQAAEPATVVVDGREGFQVHEGDQLVVERGPEPYPLLTLPALDPWRRLRDRLGWRGTIEASDP
ncbi:MAG: NAD(+)/NADH kinase [Planctomycetota bacterium]